MNCLFNENCDLPFKGWQDFTDTLLLGFNVSLVPKPLLRSPTDDKGKDIDECLRSIEKNESDAVLLPYTMPIVGKNIKTGPVFFSDKISILSTYEFQNDSSPGIFATFQTFGVDVLTLILNFFAILTVLICLTCILERKSPRRRVRINGRRFNLRFVPWFILLFFMKQFPSFPGNMTALKVLLTCCLLTFSYFVTFFYASMIKTDMVTVKAPLIIGSYQDILHDPSVEPYIRDVLDEYTFFKYADQGTLQKKIWKRILKMGVEKLVNSTVMDNISNFVEPNAPFMMQKAVIIAYSNYLGMAKYLFAIHFKSKNNVKNRRGLYVSDPSESGKSSASIMNRLAVEVLSMKYERRIRRYIEGHFWQKYFDNTALLFAEFYAYMLDESKDFRDVAEFINQRVVIPLPELVTPDLTYFMDFFITYLVLCVIQIIVFLIERWVSDKE